MNTILTVLSSHIISIIDYELKKNEPEIVTMVEQEIALLINKLESYLEGKAPKIAGLVNPVINGVLQGTTGENQNQ